MTALTQRDQSRADLKKFGRHRRMCWGVDPCTCGFTAALEANK